MPRRNKFSQEVRERAVRMVSDHRADYGAEREAIRSIVKKIGCSPETLRAGVRTVQVHSGSRTGTTGDERARVPDPEKEVRELRRPNEILRKASAYSH